MKTIEVSASKYYQIHIGRDLISTLGQQVKSVCNASKVAIVSDSNVFPLYGQMACDSLICAGFDVVTFVFSAGESSKNGITYLQLLNFLAENKLTRSDCLIALGGGVVGDLTGFAAATYLRGIPYVQVPTTLLAAVDSSVGGKTAIDLDAGKNLCGAFWQPSLVLCDIDTLNTLPEDVFRAGCAEVIKYGVLYDPKLFDQLAQMGLHFDREAVIARCVELKRDVVEQDEFDTGERMKLNLGHTIGHAVEAQSNFSISHGEAVAIGMSIAAKAAGCACAERIIATIRKFGLPTTTEFTAESLCSIALSDKKRFGGTINLIVPIGIGDCCMQALPVEQLKSFIEAGL